MAFDILEYKDLYPFTGCNLRIGAHRMHYLDLGAGAPVLMLHGNPSWSFYYRNLAKDIARTHRVIVPDHIGCGLSDKPSTENYPYTLQRRVEDLEKLIDTLDLPQKITLVVHDWGGMIGMAWAHRHPERVEKLVILNTGAFFLPAGKAFPAALRLCRDSGLGTLLVRGVNAFSVGASIVGCKRRPMSRRLRAAYQAPYDSWENRVATLRFVQDIPLGPEDSSYALVAEVETGLARFADVPMLIIWGDQDFVFDSHFLAEWQRRFPKATVHRFADAGHYVLEDVAEEAIPLIRAFIDTPADQEPKASQ